MTDFAPCHAPSSQIKKWQRCERDLYDRLDRQWLPGLEKALGEVECVCLLSSTMSRPLNPPLCDSDLE